jgi:hypothetical protein
VSKKVVDDSSNNETLKNSVKNVSRKKLDIKGFEPLTFSMQSRRSTTDLNARLICTELSAVRRRNKILEQKSVKL